MHAEVKIESWFVIYNQKLFFLFIFLLISEIHSIARLEMFLKNFNVVCKINLFGATEDPLKNLKSIKTSFCFHLKFSAGEIQYCKETN